MDGCAAAELKQELEAFVVEAVGKLAEGDTTPTGAAVASTIAERSLELYTNILQTGGKGKGAMGCRLAAARGSKGSR